jgi:UDP-3-O-[3-hydroxymyristoyl] glucosamine N-acyltransferase
VAGVPPYGLQLSGRELERYNTKEVYVESGTISKMAVVETEEVGPNVTIAEFAVVRKGAKLGKDVVIHPFVVIESGVTIGDGVEIFPGAYIGKEPKGAGALARKLVFDRHVAIGANCCIGPNAVIYCDVEIGESTLIGDGALIREQTRVGSRSVIGVYAGVGYACRIGSQTKIMGYTGVAGKSTVGDNVFISAGVSMTNDNQLGRKGWREDENLGATIEDGAMIGAGAILLPGVVIGKGAIVGSGAMINTNVKPDALMLAMPARAVPREWHKE